MKNETTKSTKMSDFVSLRIKKKTRIDIESKLKNANKKTRGRKITVDQIVQFAISKVTNEDIKILQANSLTNEDKLEQLRHLYSKKHASVTPDQFIGMVLSGQCSEFVIEHKAEIGY